MTYRISTVADVTGIPRNTLLAWERRYGLVRPTRHENGYRSYSEKDVALLLRLRNAIAAGLRISEAVELLRPDSSSPPSPGRDEANQPQDLSHIREELREALALYRRSEAEEILGRLQAFPVALRAREVYFPLLQDLRASFANGAITLAQEHYASAILRSHLGSLLVTTGSESRAAPHAIITTFPGDNHELVALVLAIQLGTLGFRVSYLGPGLSGAELGSFSRKHKPVLACVTCLTPPSDDEFSAYLAELSTCPGPRWVVGGAIPKVVPPEGILLLKEWSQFSPKHSESFEPDLLGDPSP